MGRYIPNDKLPNAVHIPKEVADRAKKMLDEMFGDRSDSNREGDK